MLLIVLMIVCAAVASVVALFTLLRNPTSSLHRWLFLLIFAACCWVISANLYGTVDIATGVWFSRLAFVSASFLAFAILRFSHLISGVAAKFTTMLFFGLLTLIGVVLSLGPWAIEGSNSVNGTPQLIRGTAYPLLILIILYPIIHGLIVLNKRRRHSTGLHRTQLLIIENGLIFGAAVGIMTNVILPNLLKTTFPSRFAFLAIIILTVSLVYAVVQHRFLDIRLTITRAAGYLMALVVVILSYSVIIFAIAQFVLANVTADHPLRQGIEVLLAIGVGFTFHPIRVFFDKITSRLFYRDAYDTKEVLDVIGDVLVEEVEVAGLVEHAGKILARAIKANHLEVVIVSRDRRATLRHVATGQSLADTSELVERLMQTRRKQVAVDELDGNHDLRRLFIEANIAVATRLETSNVLLGYLLVSYKSSGAAYTNQDVEVIRIAGDEFAVAIQNALRFEEIIHFNQKLKQEVEDATAQLRDSNRKLKKLDEAKDEFISMASHQLRTPLTSVKGYISMVMDGDAGKLTGPQQKLLEEAFSAAQRMVYLIGDFLNVSRLQTGRFVLETKRTDLAQVVSQEVSQLNTTAGRRNIQIRYHHPSQFPIVLVDESKMRQVIMNFIDNAIFYSHPSSTFDVTLVNTGSEIRFEVKDNGIGVPKVEQHKIFTKFFRAQNARHVRPDGTGVGLFMAKKVVAAHGGSIIFETKENKGSTFGFVLPIAALKHQTEKLK